MANADHDNSEQAVRTLAAVVAQLQLALSESQQPASALCDSLSSALQAVSRLRARVPDPALAAEWQQIDRDLSTCLTGMQFHDRMMQHLGHLGTFLSDLACSWDSQQDHSGAIARLRAHLITEAQRDLLDVMASDGPPAPRGAEPPPPAHGDTVELF